MWGKGGCGGRGGVGGWVIGSGELGAEVGGLGARDGRGVEGRLGQWGWSGGSRVLGVGGGLKFLESALISG